MDFVWDDSKNKRNLAKYGIAFEQAVFLKDRYRKSHLL